MTALDSKIIIRANFRQVEQEALTLRQELNYGDAPLDVFQMMQALNVRMVWSDQLSASNPDLTVKDWSGAGIALDDGRLLILLNSAATLERQHVTALEEFFHHRYGHTPVAVDAMGRSQYHEQEEFAAYQTAAACLLPARQVALAVFQRANPFAVARCFGASLELFEMRVKCLNLWPQYTASTAQGAA